MPFDIPRIMFVAAIFFGGFVAIDLLKGYSRQVTFVLSFIIGLLAFALLGALG